MSNTLNPEKETLYNRVQALPQVGLHAGVLTGEHVRFVTDVLLTKNPSIEAHIVSQVDRIADQVLEHLPKTPDSNIFPLTVEDITAIIAQAALTGAAQAASDIGESLAVIDL